MGIFGGNNDLVKQMSHERDLREMDNDTQLAQQMFDPNKVAIDSQVSALILEMKSRFLKYRLDAERGTFTCVEKYPYLEPWGEESRSFLEGFKPSVVGTIDMFLSEAYSFSEKYDESICNTFNEVVRVRHSFLGLSRATGKAAKVAKSQFIESSAMVRRDVLPKKEDKGMLGIGFMGL